VSAARRGSGRSRREAAGFFGVLAWFVAAGLAPGCSNSDRHLRVREIGDAGAGVDGDAGADAGAAAGAAENAGASAGGGAGANAGGAPGSGKSGQIIVQWDGKKVGASAFFAGAGATPSTAPMPLCQTTQLGSCSVQVCSNPDANPVTGQPASAGTITVGGGSVPLKLTPSTMFESLYELASGANATFAPGSTLTAAAAGAEVPAFSGEAAELPSPISVPGDYSVLSFDRDLTVTWSGGGSIGFVAVELNVLGDTQVGDLSCEFPPGAGTGTVPRALLGELPPCAKEQGPICGYAIEPRSRRRFAAGEYAVDFSVRAAGLSGSFSN